MDSIRTACLLKMISLKRYNLVYLDDFPPGFHYLNEDYTLICIAGVK